MGAPPRSAALFSFWRLLEIMTSRPLGAKSAAIHSSTWCLHGCCLHVGWRKSHELYELIHYVHVCFKSLLAVIDMWKIHMSYPLRSTVAQNLLGVRWPSSSTSNAAVFDNWLKNMYAKKTFWTIHIIKNNEKKWLEPRIMGGWWGQRSAASQSGPCSKVILLDW